MELDYKRIKSKSKKKEAQGWIFLKKK
jgi:hypothetical protein